MRSIFFQKTKSSGIPITLPAGCGGKKQRLPKLEKNKNYALNALKARALIITKDLSLLQRIYFGITKSLEMNK